MKVRRCYPVIYGLSVLTTISTALGDGKMFIWRNKDADIFQPTQKAYIKWDGYEEKLLLQTKYEGPAEEMVWVIPVPSEPKVIKGDPNTFERLSKETQYLDLAYTHFWRLSTGIAPPALISGKRTAVEWRKQIGDYDVALLSPIGAEQVIQWLNSNQFGVPEEAVPILNDYINERWWMVAARIHPDALTDRTREKLTEGTLHPLEMTFKVSRCVYPLRLTSLVAGPVEELIYIEGPAHYEPAALRGDWEIDVFGGPGWRPPVNSLDERELLKYFEGKKDIRTDRHLTKLRKIFMPKDMTEDIFFEKLDYAKIHAIGIPLRIGQAATQYGRHQDANGVDLLLESLAPQLLTEVRPTMEDYEQRLSVSAGILSWQGIRKHKKNCEHLRSCIWALGEIAAKHGLTRAVEQTLLRCAKHENQLIRMEAFAVLDKLDPNTNAIGPILLDRFRQIFNGELSRLSFTPTERYVNDYNIIAETEIIAEWMGRFGKSQQKAVFVETFSGILARLPVDKSGLGVGKYHIAPDGMAWWLVWQAALTKDSRLLRPLEDYRAKYSNTDRFHTEFLLKAEAACGSTEAISILARRIAENQNKVLSERETRESGGYASLQPSYQNRGISLRTYILRKREYRKESYRRMPTRIEDAVVRTALSEYDLDDWYVLYLLAYVEEPDDRDRKALRAIWDKKDSGKQLVAVAVLWTWKDAKTLLEMKEHCTDEAVAAEIQRALDSLENQEN